MGLKNGMLRKSVERNNQTLTKEKANKRKTENNDFQKGVDGQKQRNDGILKGKKKENKENAEQEEEKDFKESAFGGAKEETPLKLQEN